MKKFVKRLFLILVACGAIVFAGLATWGSGYLLHPDRRPVQDYHRRVLEHPADFGLAILPYTGPAGTPCLLVTPAGHLPASSKGKIVRDILMRRKVPLGPQGQTCGTIVLLHGYRGRKEDNLAITERLCAAGFRCLLPDLPGHGENPAPSATFGKNEAPLPALLLADANRRFSFPADQPACLFGISQGGAIVLQAAALAGETNPGQPWAAVASVSAFASLDQPVQQVAASLSPRFAVLTPFTCTACAWGVRCREGFLPSEIAPLAAASRIAIPAMIIHGQEDEFIPFSAGLAIYKAIPGPDKTFRPVPGGHHGDTLAAGSHELYADLCQFYLTRSQLKP